MIGIGPEGPRGPVARPAVPGAPPATALAAAGRETRGPGRPTSAGDPPERKAAGRVPGARHEEPHRPGSALLSEREAWIVLASVDGVGPVSFGALLRALGSARAVLDVGAGPRGPARLAAAADGEGLRLAPDVAAAIGRARGEGRGLLRRLAAVGVAALTAEDPGYPARLLAIELPPPVLFVAGDAAALAAPRAVAVVGTRRPTEDGRRASARISGALAAAGAVVVSGLAVGIDGSAHAGALLAGGATVAVLGSGHARLYPAAHAELAREIVRTGGAIAAEVPPDAEPRPAGFPRRNRIIAGLADATVVVEAGERSGALITASWALEQGRGVFACPGPLDRPASVGCNRLLREQPGLVRIVAGPDELIEDLGYAIPLPVRRRGRGRSDAPRPDPGAILARLGDAEAAVVRRLLGGAATADALAAAADLAGATVLAVLTRLEEEGLVAAAFGRYRLAGPLEGVRGAGGAGRPRAHP